MRLEQRINVAGDAGSVVGQGHRGPAHDEDVRHNASSDQALTQGSEGPFQLRAAEEDTVGFAHAASKSLPDR